MMRWLVLILTIIMSGFADAARVIHQERSLYRNIEVKESGGRRCLVFAVKRGDKNQTCINLNNRDRVVFPYVRMTFAGLLLNPEPESILVIGLGGGTIPGVLSRILPKANIHVVEIDEAVLRVAEKYFDFKQTDAIKVFVQDARVNVKRAILRQQQYDMIILDAFNGDYIPEHLMTVEFLQEVQSILSPEGVLVANTFSTSRLYHHESMTYEAVYGEFFNMKMPSSGNRVIVANGKPLPANKIIQDRANHLSSRLTPFGVNIEDFPGYMKRDKDWDVSARPLTDQFSPANLLR